VAVLCNRYEADLDRTALARAVADLYLGELSAEASSAPLPAPVPDPALLERYAGSFVSPTSTRPREFVVHEGSLAEREGDRLWPMAARGIGRFEDEQIRLDFAAEGDEAMLFVKSDGTRIRLTRMPQGWRQWTPTHGDLAAYAGTFRSAELGVEWTLRLDDERSSSGRSALRSSCFCRAQWTGSKWPMAGPRWSFVAGPMVGSTASFSRSPGHRTWSSTGLPSNRTSARRVGPHLPRLPANA
jgi:hypothetical protein